MSVAKHRDAELRLLVSLVRSLDDPTIEYVHLERLAVAADSTNCRFVATKWEKWLPSLWNIINALQEGEPLSEAQSRTWKNFLVSLEGKRFRKPHRRGLKLKTAQIRTHFIRFRARRRKRKRAP